MGRARDGVSRLTDEEFRQVAWKLRYPKPLLDLPYFPKPPDDPENFYYNLIKSPFALLWYMKLYDESDKDHRFQPILTNCKFIVPREDPGSTPPALPHLDRPRLRGHPDFADVLRL